MNRSFLLPSWFNNPDFRSTVFSFVLFSPFLQVNLPAKIFGDLHGHLADLFEFFRSFGWPDEVDKTTRQYEDFLFLGE